MCDSNPSLIDFLLLFQAAVRVSRQGDLTIWVCSCEVFPLTILCWYFLWLAVPYIIVMVLPQLFLCFQVEMHTLMPEAAFVYFKHQNGLSEVFLMNFNLICHYLLDFLSLLFQYLHKPCPLSTASLVTHANPFISNLPCPLYAYLAASQKFLWRILVL